MTICMGTNTSNQAHTQAVLDAIRRIVHALRESSRLAERLVGLSGAQFFVLQKLAAEPALSLNDLARRTHTHQSSVSMVVARLVGRGLVGRQRSSSDGRRIELSLTPQGRRVLDEGPDVAQARLVQAVERLPVARRRQLAAALTALAQATDTAERIPAMFFEDAGSRRTAGGRRG